MPDPGTADLALALSLVVSRLARDLSYHQQPGLTVSELAILADLEHGPLTPTILAETERMKPPSVTRHLRALAARGLITRQARLDDARSVTHQLTPAGRELLAVARQAHWLAAWIGELGASDRRVLANALPLLRNIHVISDANELSWYANGHPEPSGERGC